MTDFIFDSCESSVAYREGRDNIVNIEDVDTDDVTNRIKLVITSTLAEKEKQRR